MSSILFDNAADDSFNHNQEVGSTIQAMRLSLGVTVAELARASGIPGPSLAAIEQGGAATRAQRDEIAVAVGWLSNHRIARGLATQRTAAST